VTHIQDSIHGYIELSEDEKELVDKPELQRLRRIRQLGLTSLVYPSATHTRFQHSLGVMHTAGRFAESLGLDEQRKKELRIAGLLHDIGHGPFSHASEAVAEQHGISHEELSCRKIEKLGDSFEVDTDRVLKIMNKELEIGQVVAGEIDADRIDYLQRDSHGTGVEHGKIDASTIMRLAEIDSRRIVFDEKAIQSLESLLTARFHMMKSVYTHKTSEIGEKMLERSLQSYLQQGNELEEMMAKDDYTMHVALLNSDNSAKDLYQRITDRNLFKKAVRLDTHERSRNEMKELAGRDENELEKQLASETGIDSSKIIANTPVIPDEKMLNIKIKKNGEVDNIDLYTPIPEALNEAEWNLSHFSVYTPKNHTEKMESAVKKVI